LVIVTKDADFSDRIIVSNPPPRVVHLRFGNMRKNDFHAFLQNIWPQIEQLIQTH
jgi:predicted nuclease of predicted toxin-antitoxin system